MYCKVVLQFMDIPQFMYPFTCLVDTWVIPILLPSYYSFIDISYKAAMGLVLKSWRREALILLGVVGTWSHPVAVGAILLS